MVYLPAGHSQFTTHSTLFLYMSLCFSSHFTSSVCSTTEEDTLCPEYVHSLQMILFFSESPLLIHTHLASTFITSSSKINPLHPKARIIFHYLSFLFHSLCPFVMHVGEQEHPKSHVMAKFQQPHSDVPLFLLFYICHQAFWRGLLWEPCWREICLCTLTHTWHAHTCIYTSHTDA